MNWGAAVLSIVPVIAGAASGLFSQVGQWYAQLSKPTWTPPNWIFGPVWTLLYLLMGAAWYVLYTNNAPRWVLILFWVQLAVNVIWSPVFFRWHSLAGALAIILLLDILVIVLIIGSWNTSRLAAGLLTPYLLWILYASALNLSILLQNT